MVQLKHILKSIPICTSLMFLWKYFKNYIIIYCFISLGRGKQLEILYLSVWADPLILFPYWIFFFDEQNYRIYLISLDVLCHTAHPTFVCALHCYVCPFFFLCSIHLLAIKYFIFYYAIFFSTLVCEKTATWKDLRLTCACIAA